MGKRVVGEIRPGFCFFATLRGVPGFHRVMRSRFLIIALGLGVTGLAGYWLARTAVPETADVGKRKERNAAPRTHIVPDEEGPKFRRGERPAVFRSDDEALEKGAIPGQRALVFKDRDALERFLAKAGDAVRVLGRLDALNALHVSLLDPSLLADLLDGTEETSLIFPVLLPDPAAVGVQAGAMPFGNRLLEWLGISGDNSAWGTGVKVAVLDTGVSAHSSFLSAITSLNLVAMAANLADWNGHGTAVASLISGADRRTPGVAPGSDILSIRIADDTGFSNSFLLAQGIMAAVDAGVPLINISMGSLGDSALVRNAVAYAREAGVLIIAPSGNDGSNRLSYPAAYEGVISVGGVDANANHLLFSNSGNSLSLAAPGYDVNAAWPGDKAIGFTGTSASAPVVTGSIAALMTHGPGAPLTANQAVQLLMGNLNDGGAPGADSHLGGGFIDVGRAMNSGTAGIQDAAVASHWVVPGENGAQPTLQVVVQNRGTATLVNTGVTVDSGFGVRNFNLTTLAPGAIQVVEVPLPPGALASGDELRFSSSVAVSGGQRDFNPANDSRADVHVPTESR